MAPVETMFDYLAAVQALIEHHGWMVHMIERNGPIRCHSIGLSAMDHPEIIVIGFNPQLMIRLINTVGNDVKEGKKYGDWSVVRRIVKHFPVVFREIETESARRYAGLVGRFFPEHRLLQMFLPDANGLFPWQPSCMIPFKQQMCLDYVSTSDGILIYDIG